MRGRIEFRIIKDEDKAFLQALYADSRAWEFELTVWTDEEKDRFLKQQFEAQDRSYKMNNLGAVHRIIQLNGVDIGRLIIDRTDRLMRIIDFTIHSDYQRRGIGADILASLKNEAQGGKVPITLHVRQGNPALNLYLRHGFKKTGVNGHHFAMKWEPDLRPREI